MNPISSILQEVFFGKHFFIVAKILRDSLLINSILLNSEIWYNLTKSNIDDLEKLDNILLRKILEVSSSVPTVFLHLELGTLPIRFILQTRRLMFLQYILQEEETCLLHKFLISQIENPLAGDWWLSTIEDMKDLEINLTLHEIKVMTKNVFKAKVNKAASHLAFKWLSEEKLKLKKIKGIKHEKLEMQLYLSDPLVPIQTSKFLFHLRARMLFVRANFRHMYKDEICQLCCQLPGQQSVDTQEHLLSCSKLNIDTEVGKVGLDYENIFSSNLENQARITLLLESKFEKRKKLESEEK